MKRINILIAATATILAGCSNADILNTVNEEKPALITFDTYHSAGTKAPIYSETSLTKGNGGFGVFAFKHADVKNISDGKIDLSGVSDDYAVFDNTKTWYNPNYVETASPFFTKYEYEYPRYWDKQMNYTFFAYAPYTQKATSDVKGVSLDKTTGKITRNDIHKIQTASSATNVTKGSGENAVTRAQYSVSDADVEDYLLAPCVPGQKWHATNQTVSQESPSYYENAEITVGFIFHHILSQLNVSINAKNEENDPNDATKNGHEYKGIKNIYVTKLEITNLPALTNLSSNYITCQQNKVNFEAIYNTPTDKPLTFDPAYYSEKLEIVKSIAGATATDPTTYSINGETATANPLYILDGGKSLDIKAGSTAVNGYFDQMFQYFVAPNKPTAETHKHDLNIDYYIEYLDGNGKAEKFSRTIHLDEAPYNFDEMLASYIYNINITISLDQIYITVDDVLWNSGPNAPAEIVINDN